MTVAVQTLATSEYGALNDEVKKMSDQLSWGVKFSDVIRQFADRVGTPLVQRAIALIAEADRAGGKISDILVTAANDSRELKFLEGERKRTIGSYIAVIWTSYFVFLWRYRRFSLRCLFQLLLAPIQAAMTVETAVDRRLET